jgi:hypothetical protein
MPTNQDRFPRRSGGTRPAVTYHAICWRTMADFDRPYGRANAHGEAMVTPGFDSLGELNDWLSDDTEWLYEEVTRYRRAAWTGSQPRDEIITESGLPISEVEPEAIPMPQHVHDQLADLFDKLTNEDRLTRWKGRPVRDIPLPEFDATIPVMPHDAIYDEEGNLRPWILTQPNGRPRTDVVYEEGVPYDLRGFRLDPVTGERL